MLETPATDPGRAAEEMRFADVKEADIAAEARALCAAHCSWGQSDKGPCSECTADREHDWLQDAAATLATKRINSVLAQIQADLIAARKERDEALLAERETEARRQKNLEDWRESFRQLSEAWHGEIADHDANLVALAKMYGEACRDLVYARSGEDELFWQKEEAVVALSRKLVAAEAEAAQLRARLHEAEKGAEAMRDVQEAVVARWREAAMMAVGGDLRRLQRLLNASQSRIVGSASAAGDEPRCTATGNPCGTDTVMTGRQCPDNRWGGRCAHRIAEAAKLALLTHEEGR